MGNRGRINMEELIEQLIRTIEERATIPPYWDSAEVADNLRVSRRTVLEVFAPRSDFPAAFRLPTRGRGPGSPRWKPAEVIEWMESRRERTAK